MPSELITTAPPSSDLARLAHKLRRDVFIHEQNVPAELEFDEHDLAVMHHVTLLNGDLVAALRVIPLPEHHKISRFVVHRDYRGQGIGRRLLAHTIAALSDGGHDRLYLEAQVTAIGFYERLGFTAYGPVYQDAGIDHRKMRNYEPDA